MTKSHFDPLSGKHYISNHEDIGGFSSKTEAQQAFKNQSFRSGKSDGYKGYPKDEHKNTDYHKGEYMRGHAEGMKEHQKPEWKEK